MRIAACLLVVFGLATALPLGAAPVKVTPNKTWKGSVENDALMRSAPTALFDQKSLDSLWEVWKQAGKAPQVDFTKEIVVIAVTSGSSVNLALQRDEGNLKVAGFGTRDLRPGFRFVIGSVSREGITAVNGMPLPKTE